MSHDKSIIRKTWKDNALELLKTYYSGFCGTQWHAFCKEKDTDLLRVKICFALYGPPTSDSENIENAYSKEQFDRAQTLMDIILRVHADSGVSMLRVGFVFIYCKQKENEYPVPVFSIWNGSDKKNDDKDKRKFVDTQGRIYQDWDDWKDNNSLPPVKYAYPKLGYFTCSGNDSYEFDPDKDPDIEFGESPQRSLKSTILKWTDVGTAIVSIGSGIVGFVALFTPLAPIIAVPATVSGITSAIYGAGRGIGSLVDKGRHGESLTDLGSVTIWISLVATPFQFITSAVNGALVLGAQQGRIFSSSMRMFATVLNFTTLGLDSILLGCGLANLIKKAVDKELTSLDVLQFSVSVFFFTNTLIQPKVASRIIRRAQEMHFDKVSISLTDDATKQTFQKFLQDNNSGSSIKERSKIVRTVNRMDDPGKFFKSVGSDATVMVGGRKGKTVVVSDQHGHSNRIKPNETQFFTNNSKSAFGGSKLPSCLKKSYQKNPEEVELNGVKIFKNLGDRQRKRLNQTVNNTAGGNKEVILTAHDISERMGYSTSDQLISMIEIVAKKVEGKSGSQLSDSLSQIGRPGSGQQQFIKELKIDLKIATRCASKSGLNFIDPLTAVYHYRKHGADFPDRIKSFARDSMKIYVGAVKKDVLHDRNLREVCQLENGIVRKIYTNKSDEFGIITSTPDGPLVSTMYKKPGVHEDYTTKWTDYFRNDISEGPPEPISDVTQRLARFLGLRAFHVIVSVNGLEKPISECPDLDPNVHHEIVQYLNSFEKNY